MKEEELKKLVEYFEERVLTKFDYHFNKLILEDYYEGGYEMRIEDEWFYEEYFEQYEDNIINLLMSIEDEDYYDYKLRLIRLKRIIDTKLSKFNKEVEKVDNSNPPTKQTRINHFLLLTTIDKVDFILKLHTNLTTHNFIECNIEEFSEMFSKKSTVNKIHWKGNEHQITHLINHLINFMDKEVNNNKLKLITLYFINKYGNRFKAKQLGTVYSEKKDLLPMDDPIINICQEMSTHF